ncbi:1-hydroxycarotenoid 3,4-desaturase CrtD [Polynucleobacter antarcticus]|uniref:CrtD protein n=1 Tax=Polynucleobacter antarcticus TaxID=1743162 RepID=A0A6M9Q1R8_9BURK|nr:1-hydroxycarotenoid 3,4-desaturase CrtD [Polynucleobacter antarcticus]QKM62203.1 CrtD protein [Polynucleobacter antarcticus]
MSKSTKVLIVGAGIGGLTAALELAHQGLDVTVIEKNTLPGGKIRQVNVGDALIDSGPTVFTMRWIFENLFDACGESFDAELELEPLDVLARHSWGEGILDLYADSKKSADAIAQFSSPKQAQLFLAFCKTARQTYQALKGPFIESPRPTMFGMMSALGLSESKALWDIGPFSSLWSSLGKYFPDPRLHQLFGRYATYCGSSPFLAPATLMLIAQVEMEGVWSVKGGMAKIPQIVARLAQKKGCHFRYEAEVESLKLEAGKVTGVTLNSGEYLECDYLIFNGDINALKHGLLGQSATTAIPKALKQTDSLSAITWSMRVKTSGFPLLRHNVFFNQPYQSEFTDIFTNHRLPTNPSVYICAQDRTDSPLQDSGFERLLCLVNAPANGGNPSYDYKEIDQCEQKAFSLMRQYGLHLQDAQITRTSPQEFSKLFPGRKGALYGQATHGWMSSFQRLGSQSLIQNLLLTGGSTHPGPGVPMAAMSGRLAAATLMERLGLTRS